MSDAQVLIVGAGINGLCTAWALVRRGFRVTVFDQGQITNPVSSSHDEHRVTRHAYGPMRTHAARMPGAFRLWDVLFADIGARHFDPVPVVAFERAPSGWIDPSLADLDRMGLPWRELDPAGMATTHPLLRSAGVTRAVELAARGCCSPAGSSPIWWCIWPRRACASSPIAGSPIWTRRPVACP